ncbi:uncharacterized protein K460DRAFT_301972 [Cucurbitaria berberidis CBS 394.84]|uniref:Spherulin 4-like cell surface protein n=1 Tax=Cucurbitaria berberidis CBS 394.84 TaxID=1168544 RepID=A0A9P4GRW1_9PLEO|nr:uncharacterized protein K460DRAFT_301972 [Cucurbitaria berberidis CBS 394.84]KAF1850682.1 hypothetical protein K460DRAFT_301972 [Cucurbitaria berberidis CBS 394.84]
MASKVDLPTHFRDWNASSNASDGATQKPIPQKAVWKRPWFIGIAAAVVIAIIIAIVVPLAVVLPKKGKGKHDATVIVPLYIYPKDNSTWAPLYNSVLARPTLDFLVIINPSSGPGTTQYPNDQYSAALRQLSKYPNVQKIGYVRTGYASRNLTDVISELNTYAGWASKDAAFGIDGIFFDESPHEYSAEAVDFMLSASRAVKNATGLQAKKTVIRNPGVIPEARFDDANTDISVVFEQSYAEYQSKESDLAALKDGRAHHCYMVHSVPGLGKDKLRDFVDDMSKRAEYLFVTSNDKEYYEKFGSDWSDFLDVVPAAKRQ